VRASATLPLVSLVITGLQFYVLRITFVMKRDIFHNVSSIVYRPDAPGNYPSAVIQARSDQGVRGVMVKRFALITVAILLISTVASLSVPTDRVLLHIRIKSR
jgi:hypothetical protein